MKKLFSLIALVGFVSTFAFAQHHKNAEEKIKIHHVVSTLGAGAAMSVAKEKKHTSVYHQLRDKYGESRVIADSFIRMETYLVNGKSEYEFVHRLLGTEAVTEHKLNDQDAFRITDVGIYLMAENIAKPGISVLQTYPNATVFNVVGGDPIVAADLEHVYNGYLTAKIGDTTWLPDKSLRACRVVNTTLQSGANTESERKANDGMISLTPQYTLYGRENNTLIVKVPGNAAQSVVSTNGVYKTKLVLMLEGFKITGAGNEAIAASRV